VQSGYTLDDYSTNRDFSSTSFTTLGLAQNDLDVTMQTTKGWYWGIWPAILAGLVIRWGAGGAIHVVGRSKQAKRPFREDIRQRKRFAYWVAAYFVIFFTLFGIACWQIVAPTTRTPWWQSPE
jgi:hypothetical protein